MVRGTRVFVFTVVSYYSVVAAGTGMTLRNVLGCLVGSYTVAVTRHEWRFNGGKGRVGGEGNC